MKKIRHFKYWTVSILIVGAFSSILEAQAKEMNYESFVSTEKAKTVFLGDHTEGQFGAALESGDLNGDGFEDLVVGAPFTSTEGRLWNGAVEIIWGGDEDLQEKKTIYGANEQDQLGTTFAVGDLNNDGIDDLIVGAYNAYHKGTRPGKVYVFYGNANLKDNEYIDLSLREADFTLKGFVDGVGFGLDIDTVDLDNDGIEDLIVGAPFDSSPYFSHSGMVYVYEGNSKGLEVSASRRFYGQSSGEKFGSSVSGGDIDGDGLNELVVGAYGSSVDGVKGAGRAYIYNGTLRDISVVDKPDNVLTGEFSGQWFGFDVEVDKLNGDVYSDVIVSSFPYEGENVDARVNIWLGQETRLENNDSHELIYPYSNTVLGSKVVVGDFDGNGRGDLAVGAPAIVNGEDSGDVFVRYNGGEMTLALHGEKANDWFGYNLTAADLNGDGFQDLAVGARYADIEDGVNNGKVYVLWGSGRIIGNQVANRGVTDNLITRGEIVSLTLDQLNLENKRKDFLDNCYDYLEFCLFNFMAVSDFDDIQLEPELILYPDVKPGDPYADQINAATMLGIVSGHVSKENSPFEPNKPVTRIQALKIVLGASGLVEAKYKFELAQELGSYAALLSQVSNAFDIDAAIDKMWWYPRYVNFAISAGIVPEGEFRPDEYIEVGEFADILKKTVEYLNTTSDGEVLS